jgi:hypothetical protein
VTFTIKKYLLKHKVFSYVASASFRTIASQLSGFREKRILRNSDAKLTPKTKLEGQDPFSSISLKTWLTWKALKLSRLQKAQLKSVLLQRSKHALEKTDII